VGAPHRDEEMGAVYIYQGTNDGFSDKPQVHIIMGNHLLSVWETGSIPS